MANVVSQDGLVKSCSWRLNESPEVDCLTSAAEWIVTFLLIAAGCNQALAVWMSRLSRLFGGLHLAVRHSDTPVTAGLCDAYVRLGPS